MLTRSIAVWQAICSAHSEVISSGFASIVNSLSGSVVVMCAISLSSNGNGRLDGVPPPIYIVSGTELPPVDVHSLPTVSVYASIISFRGVE